MLMMVDPTSIATPSRAFGSREGGVVFPLGLPGPPDLKSAPSCPESINALRDGLADDLAFRDQHGENAVRLWAFLGSAAGRPLHDALTAARLEPH